jgi:TonB family protein
MMRFNLITGCFLSLGVHAGVFFLTPGSPFQPVLLSEPPTDAELVVLDVPIPPALQPPPQPPVFDEDAQSASSAQVYDATRIIPPDVQRINGAIEKMSTGVSAQLPLPTLQLPTHKQLEETPLPLMSPSRELPAATAAMLEQSSQVPGFPTGMDKQIGWGQVRLGEKQSPSRLDLPKLDRRLVARAVPLAPSLPVLPPIQPLLGIQGPAAKREPRHRPPLPKVQVQVESEITLKFWVRPDGVVSRILPERKGDTRLEAVAIRYLEGWRFTPLPQHEPQVEQWGTITVRFLLHK